MSMNIIREFVSDVGKFFVSTCTPNKDYEEDHGMRKLSMGLGLVGVVAGVALGILSESAVVGAAIIGCGLCAFVGGVVSIPVLSVLPAIALAGAAIACLDTSDVVFVAMPIYV